MSIFTGVALIGGSRISCGCDVYLAMPSSCTNGSFAGPVEKLRSVMQR